MTAAKLPPQHIILFLYGGQTVAAGWRFGRVPLAASIGDIQRRGKFFIKNLIKRLLDKKNAC